jgi:hypothetical protein
MTADRGVPFPGMALPAGRVSACRPLARHPSLGVPAMAPGGRGSAPPAISSRTCAAAARSIYI